MPNRAEHLAIGFVAYLILLYIFNIYLGIDNVDGIAFIAILVGSIMPDRLEPYTEEKKWRHRDKFHSPMAEKLTFIISMGILLLFISPLPNIITFFGLGYFLHLFRDSFTKTGYRGH